MIAVVAALAAACPPHETFIETDRPIPPGAVELVLPVAPLPGDPSCVDAETGTDCPWLSDDVRRFLDEHRRLDRARVVAVARVVPGGICVPVNLKRGVWLRTSVGHWPLPTTELGPRMPSRKAPRFDLRHVTVSGAPAGTRVLVLPAARVVPSDGGVVEFDVVGPLDTVTLLGVPSFQVSEDDPWDGGVARFEVSRLADPGPEIFVSGASEPIEVFAHAWTREAGAYDPENSTRRAVPLRGGHRRLPAIEPEAVIVVEARRGALVGAAKVEGHEVRLKLERPAKLELPRRHQLVEWLLVEDLGADDSPRCESLGQPWKRGVLVPGRPITLAVPAGRRCVTFMLQTEDETAVPWIIPVPAAGQLMKLPLQPPPDE